MATSIYSTEQKYMAWVKEPTASRGTAVTTGFKYIPVGKDTEFDFKVNLVADEQIRGILERFRASRDGWKAQGKYLIWTFLMKISGSCCIAA